MKQTSDRDEEITRLQGAIRVFLQGKLLSLRGPNLRPYLRDPVGIGMAPCSDLRTTYATDGLLADADMAITHLVIAVNTLKAKDAALTVGLDAASQDIERLEDEGVLKLDAMKELKQRLGLTNGHPLGRLHADRQPSSAAPSRNGPRLQHLLCRRALLQPLPGTPSIPHSVSLLGQCAPPQLQDLNTLALESIHNPLVQRRRRQ